ncbi:histone deacetylase domain-containing protein [Desarmillaria tabescens]|uniref:Histone deacetylase domain-containing protein n=1 Tax=Armillaria tabescens TaxID=1929756 RepID=A0AA39N2R0_ARMTA|nr:histone deacetylase domain-containing protein [Desarmillaria tabescens]KAK0455328.1 histone deacetylase domain-containing protein [Desarmillaria tabescens]
MAPAKAGVFIQDACYQHQYIRSKDTSLIVERPERLRAVKLGVAAALSRIPSVVDADGDPDDLAAALSRLDIAKETGTDKVEIIRSTASVDILHHPAVKFVHGDLDGDVYIPKIKSWADESRDKIAKGESEIPEGYSQGDLYLCPESIVAIQGALGSVCEAVDTVVASSKKNDERNGISRAFVAIRPPGHHCGEDTPEGFCFVNNVAVAAAHAHLQHGINRVVIFDIDLHHGNGTQSIVWQINEESYRKTLESEGGAPDIKPGPRIFYSSIHDILSYPCEDGKPQLVQAASVSIHGAHGQYIENVHLQTYESQEHFFNVLYPQRYAGILRKAEQFLDETGGPGDDILFFISCGMDACEHEYESMSRHNRKVPTSFYHRFTQDACSLSERYAGGRIISVLEGGYSDRALTSATFAHILGLADLPPGTVQEDWWSLDNLVALEKATKKRRGAPGPVEPWVEKAARLFASLESKMIKVSGVTPPMSMTLRERKKASGSASPAGGGSPAKKEKSPVRKGRASLPVAAGDGDSSSSSSNGVEPTKKLPRVILKLGPNPSVA